MIGPFTRSFSTGLSGVLFDYIGTASALAVTTDLHVTSFGSNHPVGTDTLLFLTFSATQMTVAVSGSLVPNTVDIDITMALSTNITDSSPADLAGAYRSSAWSSIGVAEAGTYQPPTNNPLVGQIVHPFAAISTAGNFTELGFTNHHPTQTSRTETHTFRVKPNTLYLLLATSGTWFLVGDPPGGDFNGLNVNARAVTDPVFRLNPDWAVQNPAIAQNTAIQRVLIPGPPEPMDVRIRPTPHSPSNINPNSSQTLPVAIMATGIIDANQIDASTVRFGPAGARPVRGSGLQRDIDLDGKTDLQLFFKTKEAGIPCGATQATLTAKTVDGVPLTGSDSIRTVGCR
jgi:hypothetical protein